MRRRRVIIALAACVLVGVGVVAFWPGEKEPEYNGKKLSEWLETSRYMSPSPGADAVRKMGTNAVPWLVRWLNYNAPEWKAKFTRARFFDYLPSPLSRLITRRERRSFEAYEGFRILRETAHPAIPELVKMIDNYPGESSRFAILSLGEIGGDAVMPLFQVATNKANAIRLREWAFEALSYGKFPKVETDDEHMSPLIPILVPCLFEPGLEQPTMRFIGRLGMTPDVALYISTNAVASPSPEVRVWAINWGARIATNTAQLIPELKKCLQDSDTKVRQEATNALEKIAPEVLTNEVNGF